MNKKLYVGNLSYATTEADLRKLFSESGTVVSATIIMDRETGQSKGFGFVEMETTEAAQAAINKFNNYEFNRRNITVSEARPPKENSYGGGSRGGSGGGSYNRDNRSGGGGNRNRSSSGGGSNRY
ncbi:MAG: RNA-binding protein [Anaerolineales bacterium]|nr:RNA-binding protein [Anaerolineales bacterium]